jgi:hypothetical protein
MFEKKKAQKAARADKVTARRGLSSNSSYKVSSDVTVVRGKEKKPLLTTEGKYNNLGGAAQARVQNSRSSATPSKSEAKANARGLKAANSPKRKPMK